MAKEPAKRTFGNYLQYFRNRTRSENGKALSQGILADEMNHYPNVMISKDHIYKWEKGKSILGPKDRQLVIVIIKVLVDFKGINEISEANQFLAAGGLRNLDNQEIGEIHFAETLDNYLEKLAADTQKHQDDSKKTVPAGGGRSRKLDPINFMRTDLFFARPPKQSEDVGSPKQPPDKLIRESQINYGSNIDLSIADFIPRLPANFILRGNDLANIKLRLNQVNTGDQPNILVLTAAEGKAGIGLSTTAVALANDTDIRQKYPDGMLWVSVGGKPNLLRQLQLWGEALGLARLNYFTDIKKVASLISNQLSDKRMLLLVDDVQNASDAFPFILGGSGCSILITTQTPDVAAKIVPSRKDIYEVGALSDEEALSLLSQLSPQTVTNHSTEAIILNHTLNGHPLAIQIAGRLLKANSHSGLSVLALIKEIQSGMENFSGTTNIAQDNLINACTPSIAALLYLSLNGLDTRARNCFTALRKLLPAPTKYTSDLLASIWGISDPDLILKVLVDKCLLEFLPNKALYQIHPLIWLLAKSL